MNRFAFITIVCTGLVVLAALASYSVYGEDTDIQAVQSVTPAAGDDSAGSVGGSFSLVDHTGQDVTEQDYGDRYKMVFFGFTHCPDVCPAGMKKMAAVYEALGEPREDLAVLFITIDPERDTPAVMKEYVAMFNDDFIGLTGTRPQIDKTINNFKVYAARAEDETSDDEHYMMNHSAYIYLLDPDNEAIEFFGSSDSPQDISETIKPLL